MRTVRDSGGGAGAIAQRIQSILAELARAAGRAGRRPDTVRLVAATKFVAVDQIREAVSAGVKILGESRLQEALPKLEALGNQDRLRWHFIGRLQRRKVKEVVGRFDLIHSVDSLDLAGEIDRRACAAGCPQEVLLEVNLGQETTKGGFSPSALQDARVLAELDGMPHLSVRGLMAIPPMTEAAEAARPYFLRLRELAQGIAARGLSRLAMEELSMGMSADYSVAVEEGATLVRIGTAIFGPRPLGTQRSDKEE